MYYIVHIQKPSSSMLAPLIAGDDETAISLATEAMVKAKVYPIEVDVFKNDDLEIDLLTDDAASFPIPLATITSTGTDSPPKVDRYA